MQRFIKSIGWLLLSGVCLALTSWVLAEQPVKIEPEGEGAWRLTTTLMGQADRLDWAKEDVVSGSIQIDRPPIEWANQRDFVEIEWVVRSDGPPEPATWPLTRSFEGQTETVWINIDPTLEVIGPIQSGMTLWGIANGWLDNWDERGEGQRPRPTMPDWMDSIMQANPQAFETDQANSLMRGAMLRHPIHNARATTTQLTDSLPDTANQSAAAEGELSQPSARAPFLNDSLEPDLFESEVRAETQTSQEPTNSESFASEPSDIERPLDRPSAEPDDPNPMQSAAGIERMAPKSSLFEFGFLDQPDWWRQEREMGRVAFVSGLVVVCLLILHGWSKVGGTGWRDERTQALGAFGIETPAMAPEAVTMTLDLAERYLAMGDAAQALHWLEEVIAHGTPKEVRHAKRLWRQALALIHGVSEPGSRAG
ncbi:MAG TPA: FimV/HubP family polar landmark protein [Wenzhouxiangella sp.]